MNYHARPLSKENVPYLPEHIAKRIDAVITVAEMNADSVDREARFPAEAIAALKAQKLMSIMVPVKHGGDGASIGDAAEVCYRLGRACSSAGMIYAMHLVKVACIVNHGQGVAWQDDFLKRLAREQLLLASSTTEGLGGGNVRSSASAIEPCGEGRFTYERDASCISYGAFADGLVTTARRAGGVDSSDQVLLVLVKENYTIDVSGSWDTLGMRGTCSTGFSLKADGVMEQILPHAYARIHVQTMAPAAHILWSATWAGIAAGAVQKAENFVRKVMRASGGNLPPGGNRLSEAKSKLRMLRALLADSVDRYESVHTDEQKSASLDYQSAMALTKVESAELALAIVMSCYKTCGLTGYRNDSEASIGRALRDILSAPIMIHNDRIMSSMTNALVMSGVPDGLRG